MTPEIPFVLGGHSYISQLGTDPQPTEGEIVQLVADCLDNGIRWFDTTYLPERVALGKALAELGRRQEATILAWNFFTDFGAGEAMGGHIPYQPHHLDQMRHELQTDFIDILIVHPVGDSAEQWRQKTLAQMWKEQGAVGKLGTWLPNLTATSIPYDFVVAPCNLTTSGTKEQFELYQAQGWEVLATSPFVRGWELEKLVERTGMPKETLADLMLRYVLFHPNVSRTIIAMRRREWILSNRQSWERGPLTSEETQLLRSFYPALFSE